jgi:hypothetical protein
MIFKEIACIDVYIELCNKNYMTPMPLIFISTYKIELNDCYFSLHVIRYFKRFISIKFNKIFIEFKFNNRYLKKPVFLLFLYIFFELLFFFCKLTTRAKSLLFMYLHLL